MESSIALKLRTLALESFSACFSKQLPEDQFVIQATGKEHEGDFTLLVFPLARIAGAAPHEVADQLGKSMCAISPDYLKGYQVVKGFLNLTLQDSVWLIMFSSNQLQELSRNKTGKVMVEFSSPNTNKPLHLGHLRNIFLGDSLSRILAASGKEVVKVNLINDRGIHICKSMVAYKHDPQPKTPENSQIKGDHLVGDYYVAFDKMYKAQVEDLKAKGLPPEAAEKQASVMLEAQEMLRQWEGGNDEVLELWKTMNSWVYSGFESTYQSIGVQFDKFYYESDTYLLGKDIIEEGLNKGVFYKQEDSSVWIDLTEEKLDHKLVLRGDGTSVYITQDMGTADLKFQDFGCDRSIYVVGNEQDYHFKVLFTILGKLKRTYAAGLHHMSYGMVDLPTGRMKSREGTVVDADDLISEMRATAKNTTESLGKTEGMSVEEADALYHILGMGALKYFLLKVDPKKKMLFDPEESVQFQGNTGPFIQYTHARIRAILRKAQMDSIQGSLGTNQSLEPAERTLLAMLHKFPSIVHQAAEEYSPALVANYAFDLAKEYNRFYAELPIFNDPNPEKVLLRIQLSEVTGKTIKESFQLLNIDVPERM